MNFYYNFAEVCPNGPINNIPALVQIMDWRQQAIWLDYRRIYASFGLNELKSTGLTWCQQSNPEDYGWLGSRESTQNHSIAIPPVLIIWSYMSYFAFSVVHNFDYVLVEHKLWVEMAVKISRYIATLPGLRFFINMWNSKMQSNPWWHDHFATKYSQRHSIGRPWGRNVQCVFWVLCLIWSCISNCNIICIVVL